MILSDDFSLSKLKDLSFAELQHLADEIRQKIIEVMSINGGHLASNLGVVELTVALHKVFNSPEDKLIFDVGHQTYTHKILTGRAARFPTIRKYKGLSGFSNPKESPHDHFFSGHAGNALSLAIGMVKNRDLANHEEYIIPIIGDASLTCGLTLEALNNLSRHFKRLIIILNDNAMSISKNVGAISHILSRFLSNPTTNKIYQEIDTLVSRIPKCGPQLSHQGHKITESLKNLVSPAAFFEQYGLSYIGPIDGHDIKKMVDAFTGVKDSSWPIIIHVLTQKGKGMYEATKNPVSYHGARPFSRDTGKFLSQTSQLTFPKVFGSHILEMAEKDPHLVVITPAMSCGSCLDNLMEKFPERCIDVGIAESHAVTYAGGIAHGGKRKVFVSIYSSFLQRAFDNLFHDVCLQEFPVVFAIDRAGISGPDGPTHHGIYDISFLNAMPNMVITQPRDGHVLKELMESACDWNCPTAIRYPNLPTKDTHSHLRRRELGKGEVLIKGSDILIIALGHMNDVAIETHALLESEGLYATVLDPIFIKPLDTELLCDLLLTHQKIVTLEEHSVISGIGSIINHFLMRGGFSQVQVLNLGIPETFLSQGSHAELMNEMGLVPSKIVSQIMAHFNFRKEKQHTPLVNF